MSNVWSTLSKFDVSAQVEKKGRFDYLSWAWAWAYVREVSYCYVREAYLP